jgi:hypothetical protein
MSRCWTSAKGSPAWNEGRSLSRYSRAQRCSESLRSAQPTCKLSLGMGFSGSSCGRWKPGPKSEIVQRDCIRIWPEAPFWGREPLQTFADKGQNGSVALVSLVSGLADLRRRRVTSWREVVTFWRRTFPKEQRGQYRLFTFSAHLRGPGPHHRHRFVNSLNDDLGRKLVQHVHFSAAAV